ncbi:hypothetical protein BGZ80_000607 [Entomortierella chlamydospora]|uniref:Uncharacterized protein n=1 Tax=Entomortierella chlamydospora TaxID=101097 RepID=A0A9P6MSM6_9FUNG|nr:hypothetical protein BGZ79_004499 [Entomortierella chlamydospora]KAG0011542.1 hypothetical protein BGZ80_000607 [Entomortierella chlamydospora]
MSSVRVASRERDRDSDSGSPAPRIRVGFIPQADNHDGVTLKTSQGMQRLQPANMPSSSMRSASPNHSPSTSASLRKRKSPFQEIDQQLSSIRELLTETVLLPSESPVDPSSFHSLGCLELYDQDQRICVQGLRDERKRLLEKRQAMELEWMKQETVEMQLSAEEKRLHHLELATETAGLAPETLAPMSASRVKLLDDLGTILSKIRTLLETVHLQRQQQLQHDAAVENGQEESHSIVNMAMFQKHGLMDLYDQDPSQCLVLLRVEHARLAARRDDLELEYERQRTALLKTLQ